MLDFRAVTAGSAKGEGPRRTHRTSGTSAVVSIPRREAAQLLREVVGRGATVRLPVAGSSMHPAVRSGDVVTVAPIGPGPVPVGSIVAAEAASADGLVVHRLVARTRAGVVLRGDNGAVPDGVLPESALIGVVVDVERAGRVVRAGVSRLRRPMAVLVRLGLVRRWNRVRGLAGRLVPFRPGTVAVRGEAA